MKLLGAGRTIVTALLASLIGVGLAGCERYALDRQMEELCAKDGGIKVYETVTLPATYFYTDGRLKLGDSMPYGSSSNSDEARIRSVGADEYRFIFRRQVLVGATVNLERGGGQLVRHHLTIHRRSDGKLLAEQVQYDRIGGDGIALLGFQPGSTVCPSLNRGIETLTFIRGD